MLLAYVLSTTILFTIIATLGLIERDKGAIIIYLGFTLFGSITLAYLFMGGN